VLGVVVVVMMMTIMMMFVLDLITRIQKEVSVRRT